MRNIGITTQLYFTMILLYLRTILVAIFFLVLPFVASGIVAFFTLMSVKLFLLSIFGVVSLVFFIVIVHLNSTLEIFIEATWYEAYQLCKKEDAENGHGEHNDSHGHDTQHDTHDSHDTHHENH